MNERQTLSGDQLTPKDRKEVLRIVKGGIPLVKPELRDQWRDYSDVRHPKSLMIYSDALAIMKALSAGESVEEAYKPDWYKQNQSESEITRWAVAITVIHFHPRGGELKGFLDPGHIRFAASLGE